MNRLLRSIIYSCILMLLFSACSNKHQVTELDQYAGFTSERTEGGQPIENANAASLDVSGGQDTVIKFDFVCGSRISGDTEESPAGGVPEYAVYLRRSPARLVVEFNSLSYWDYTYSNPVFTDMIYGCFQQKLFNSEQISVYFQLSTDVLYSVKEEGSSLMITLHGMPQEGGDEKGKSNKKADEGEPDYKYYVTANAFRQYCSGEISREFALTPVLCRNGTDIVLISEPFDNQEEAEQYKAILASQITALSYEQYNVVALYHNDMPEYDEALDYAPSYTAKVIRIEGTQNTLDVVIPDGFYLCTAPDNSSMLYAKRLREYNDDPNMEATEYEELWTLNSEGIRKQLLHFEFATIERAEYSADGRKLAVLERAGEGSHLYVFDCDTNELLADLSEAGFGNVISNFIWDNMGKVIYAVSGSGAMQVHQYDFSVPDESKRHAIVDKNGASDGPISFFDSEVYFVQSSLEAGYTIYRIKPEGGVRREFAKGSSFAFSNDFRYTAISRTGGVVEGEGQTEFIVYDNSNGESRLITAAFAVYDYVWSADSSRIFYFENRFSSNENESSGETKGSDEGTVTILDNYPFTLWMYELSTGQSVRIGDVSQSTIADSGRPGQLYLLYYDPETMGGKVRATYVINY